MEKKNFVLWFYGEPIVVQKRRGNGGIIFLFNYSFSKFEEFGLTKADMKMSIDGFIREKEERTVLSEDIENYRIINLDT
jgi:hypothetical protein